MFVFSSLTLNKDMTILTQFYCVCIRQGLKSQSRIKMNIVRCPPVTMVLIRRPDLRYQLGFSVQNGIVSVTVYHHTHQQKDSAVHCF